MGSTLATLAFGFFLGMRHATDADHVLAVSTLVTREKSARAAAWLGLLWGVGHSVTILIVGGILVGFSVVFSARVGLSMELAVAIMLLVLGGANIASFYKTLKGVRGGAAHAHHHAHESVPPRPRGVLGPVGLLRALRSMGIGVVHGLAGSAAVVLMALPTLRSPASAILYLFLFGIGTVAGMMLITSAMAVPVAVAATRFQRANRHLGWVSGLLSVGLGISLVYQIGFVDGLFTANPSWDPH